MKGRLSIALWILAAGVVAALSIWAIVDNAKLYFTTLLNSLTLASLYFLVASGFTLVFGLMRNVNLAHGSLYLFGAYVGWVVGDHTGSWVLAAIVWNWGAERPVAQFSHRTAFLLQGDSEREAIFAASNRRPSSSFAASARPDLGPTASSTFAWTTIPARSKNSAAS